MYFYVIHILTSINCCKIERCSLANAKLSDEAVRTVVGTRLVERVLQSLALIKSEHSPPHFYWHCDFGFHDFMAKKSSSMMVEWESGYRTVDTLFDLAIGR